MANEMVSSGLQYLTGGSVPLWWHQRLLSIKNQCGQLERLKYIPKAFNSHACGIYAVHLGISYTEDGEFGSALKLSMTRNDRAAMATKQRKYAM